MKELQFFNFNNVNVVDSRQVAEMTGKRHDHLIRDIKNYCDILVRNNAPRFGVVDSTDEISQRKFVSSDFFIENTYTDNKGETRPCYLLTKKGCDMVANKMTGERGVLFTAAYVTAFEKMQEHITKHALPQDYVSALRELLASEEKKLALQKKVEQDAPKVLFADSVTASHTSILIFDLAKLLRQNGVQIGGNRLFDWMRGNGYLIKRKGSDYNMPTQKSMELGLFEVKETSITHSDGHVSVNKTPKVTGKGQIYFINKFLH